MALYNLLSRVAFTNFFPFLLTNSLTRIDICLMKFGRHYSRKVVITTIKIFKISKIGRWRLLHTSNDNCQFFTEEDQLFNYDLSGHWPADDFANQSRSYIYLHKRDAQKAFERRVLKVIHMCLISPTSNLQIVVPFFSLVRNSLKFT